MTNELNETLQSIREISGVENVILVQRDGLPITSAGVWFSKEEVFAVASTTCAIFGVAKLVHYNFKYLLMESETSKIFLATLPNAPDYFLTVTTAPRVNLAALFIEMKDNLSRIAFLLHQHIDGKLPPLRSFTTEETQRILRDFSISDAETYRSEVTYPIISLDKSSAYSLREVLKQINENIEGTKSAFFALNGGVRISLAGFTDDRMAAMTFALFDASSRVVRILRNTHLERVLCETTQGRHFIYSVPNGVFSLWIAHSNQKLGLLRLLLKHYLAEARFVLESLSITKRTIPQEIRDILLTGIGNVGAMLSRGET